MRIHFIWLLYGLIISSCASPAKSPSIDGLSEIKQRGVIRIGTTGDYRPYSYEDDGLTGIDIDLSRELAKKLGVSVVFVPTTWQNLLKDFEMGKFDLAMSGISETPERAQAAFLSRSYWTSGKTPIGRCTEKTRFNTLAKIDQPTTKIITNAGGTNEQFARTHFLSAQIIVYPNNKDVFTRLLEGQADVMFTDSEEVAVRTRFSPGLCPTMPGTEWDKRGKVILIRKDQELKTAVDAWIDQSRGYIGQVLKKYLERGAGR